MEKYCLKWEEFQINTTQCFRELRDDFCDVTLVSEDKQQIKAHKIILAASSNWFRDTLKDIQNPNPLIFMRSIQGNQLSNIIDYMYLGEVNVYQDDLVDFLALAAELEMKGLTGVNQRNMLEEKTSIDLEGSNQKSIATYNNEENSDISIDIQDISLNSKTNIKKSQTETTFPTDEVFDINIQLNSMMEKINGLWTCKVCGKSNKGKGDTRRHTEVHIEGVHHSCAMCGKKFKLSHSLTLHRCLNSI